MLQWIVCCHWHRIIYLVICLLKIPSLFIDIFKLKRIIGIYSVGIGHRLKISIIDQSVKACFPISNVLYVAHCEEINSIYVVHWNWVVIYMAREKVMNDL